LDYKGEVVAFCRTYGGKKNQGNTIFPKSGPVVMHNVESKVCRTKNVGWRVIADKMLSTLTNAAELEIERCDRCWSVDAWNAAIAIPGRPERLKPPKKRRTRQESPKNSLKRVLPPVASRGSLDAWC